MNPYRFQWKSRLYPATTILTGLIPAQIIATIQVFLSNRSLYHTLTSIHEAGYLTVPNQKTVHHLQELSTAACGGLFFTLSAGAGISLLSFAAAWFWDRICLRKHFFPVPLLILYAALIVGVNWNGFSPFMTLYFAVIPPVVFMGTLGWMPRETGKRRRPNGLLHMIPIIVLGLLWVPQLERNLFIGIRDHLLLSNPAGQRIVQFYYSYTLYPAEALKPLDRKLLKTCTLETVSEGPHKNELRKTLSIHDWLETENKDGADLALTLSGNRLLLSNGNDMALTIPKNEFLSHPATALKQFSYRVDRHPFFRQFTFYSLLFAFPITVYIFGFSVLYFFIGRWTATRIAAILSTSLCFSMALMLLMPFWKSNSQAMGREYLSLALESDNRNVRLTALKRIREDHLDPWGFSAYETILTSPDAAERYWLAKSLGVSQSDRTHEDLLKLLEDPSPIVVSAALFSLGRRGEKKAISKILHHIQTSDHWYIQRYAYKALKSLGWKQKNTFPRKHFRGVD